MTKKENRREEVRRARHILNRNFEDNLNMSGHKMNGLRYGDGLSRKMLRVHNDEDAFIPLDGNELMEIQH